MRKPTTAAFLALITAVLPMCAEAANTFVVIVHPDNPIGWVAEEELSDMFTTKQSHWKDDVEVQPVDLKTDSALRRDFSATIHHKTVTNVESFIRQQIFSGRAKPPLVVETESEVIDFVRQNRGAVGYVSASTDISKVRKLDIALSPVRISMVKPRYTAGAQRMKIHGDVVLEVLIDTEGNVADVTPVKTLGMGLTDSAVHAVQKWKYQPAMLGGEPVETTIRVTVKF